jgi:hypothetical protein
VRLAFGGRRRTTKKQGEREEEPPCSRAPRGMLGARMAGVHSWGLVSEPDKGSGRKRTGAKGERDEGRPPLFSPQTLSAFV